MEQLRQTRSPKVLLLCKVVTVYNAERTEYNEALNRVEEIRKAKFNFRYIPGNQNAMDVATRGLSPIDLMKFNLWWYEPSWLKGEENEWPQCEFKQKSSIMAKKISGLMLI
uniref:Uncharacterized protein n=1 Tax=Loa loa TaxID=7209 RepID=A0A1I7VP82_LOALO